jgi:hypothetical protein
MVQPDGNEISFMADLTVELLKSAPRQEFNNFDTIRFPVRDRRLGAKQRLVKFAAAHGFYRFDAIPKDKLYEILGLVGIQEAYALLADEASKKLFVKLLVYRMLGPQHVRLPLNNEKFWELRESLGKYVEKADSITGIPIVGSLELLRFNGLRFFGHRLAIETAFVLEQYRYEPAGIAVQPGDVVIDAGGCWGDTALYFAHKGGRVFCFECIPSNLKILEENLKMNPTLTAQITVIPKALWDHSRQKLAFEDRGPGSLPASAGPTVDAETLTVDDFVYFSRIPR